MVVVVCVCVCVCVCVRACGLNSQEIIFFSGLLATYVFLVSLTFKKNECNFVCSETRKVPGNAEWTMGLF